MNTGESESAEEYAIAVIIAATVGICVESVLAALFVLAGMLLIKEL